MKKRRFLSAILAVACLCGLSACKITVGGGEESTDTGETTTAIVEENGTVTDTSTETSETTTAVSEPVADDTVEVTMDSREDIILDFQSQRASLTCEDARIEAYIPMEGFAMGMIFLFDETGTANAAQMALYPGEVTSLEEMLASAEEDIDPARFAVQPDGSYLCDYTEGLENTGTEGDMSYEAIKTQMQFMVDFYNALSGMAGEMEAEANEYTPDMYDVHVDVQFGPINVVSWTDADGHTTEDSNDGILFTIRRNAGSDLTDEQKDALTLTNATLTIDGVPTELGSMGSSRTTFNNITQEAYTFEVLFDYKNTEFSEMTLSFTDAEGANYVYIMDNTEAANIQADSKGRTMFESNYLDVIGAESSGSVSNDADAVDSTTDTGMNDPFSDVESSSDVIW